MSVPTHDVHSQTIDIHRRKSTCVTYIKHTCTHRETRTHTDTDNGKSTDTETDTDPDPYTYPCTCYTDKDSRTYIHIQTYIHACMHAYIHT